MDKTNAMRILDKAKIEYKTYEYEHKEGFVDGVSVAERLGQDVKKVFKTIVAIGANREYLVIVLPVDKEINFKAAAKAFGVKSAEPIKVTEITKVTGYIRGGCSPIGMKKLYRTVIDSSCKELTTVIVSAGKIGMQIELPVDKFISLINATVSDITA